ncbi:hypothetical protein Y032_0502g2631 [Ancylostoma ceylanicum]|uniref:Reverse transcriptase domain-containing protein n=1 Tax=Ancylostoma ceylanicum TaxID=53326 RepID=A0A016WVW0_9BILA|nr:hypothetical protein Y032_0502g2631 [Ancylostoma ceylanicum]
MFKSSRWFALFIWTRNGEHHGELLHCSLQVGFGSNCSSEPRRRGLANPDVGSAPGKCVGKAPGVDGITAELLQSCGPTLYTALARRFSLYLAKCEVPAAWKHSSTILLFKKGDKEDLENYRPITLLPVLYKISTRSIMTRIRRTLDEAQPVEQTGFRRKLSTLDHMITSCRLIEVARE